MGTLNQLKGWKRSRVYNNNKKRKSNNNQNMNKGKRWHK